MAGRLERVIRRRLTRRTAKTAADQPPPICPAGWHTGPPDFVGVGVQRAGTSWWFRELSSHPDFAEAPGARKELHFFDPFSDRPLRTDDINRYHRWFPRPAGAVAGEWTPAYVYEPWAVPLLIEAAPDARILLLLRDPMDRFRSGLDLGLSRGLSHSEATIDAFHRGLYSGQVARLVARVPRSRLLVLLYEELRAGGAEQRRRTAAFLGLDPDRFPRPVAARPPRQRPEAGRVIDGSYLAGIRESYRDDFAALAPLLPEVDFARWSTLQPR